MTDLTEQEVAFRASIDRCTTTMHNHQISLSEGDIYYRVYFHHSQIWKWDALGVIHFKECVFHGCKFFRNGMEVNNILEMFDPDEIRIDDISRERCRNVGTSMYDPVGDRLKERVTQ